MTNYYYLIPKKDIQCKWKILNYLLLSYIKRLNID